MDTEARPGRSKSPQNFHEPSFVPFSVQLEAIMAEISEAPPDNPNKDSGHRTDQPDFDPETMRKTKPGLKRLVLTISVLFSFLLGTVIN